MPWWYKSFLVVLAGLVLLLLGDVAARSSGFQDAAACRLAGAALMGLGVYLAVTADRAPARKRRGSR